MSNITQSVSGEEGWIVIARKSKSKAKNESVKVYSETEMKALLAADKTNWADHEDNGIVEPVKVLKEPIKTSKMHMTAPKKSVVYIKQNDEAARSSKVPATLEQKNKAAERRKRQRQFKAERKAGESDKSMVGLASGQAETVRPFIPVRAVGQNIVVTLPPSPPQSATPAFPKIQTVAMELPQSEAPKSSSPRGRVNPIVPVIPRSFKRTAVTPPPSGAQPQFLKTIKEADETCTIIVADSASSRSRSPSSSNMSPETASETESSDSLNQRPVFMRSDSEVQDDDEWYSPINRSYDTASWLSSSGSTHSSSSRLSPTAEPFVPCAQMEQYEQGNFEIPPGHYLPEYGHTLPDPSNSPLELTPQGMYTSPMEVTHPFQPALSVGIPGSMLPLFSPQPYFLPPPIMIGPPVPIHSNYHLESLRQERNRLDLILTQDDLIRDIESRAARLALRGLNTDGKPGSPLQVQAWEMQQKQQMNQMQVNQGCH